MHADARRRVSHERNENILPRLLNLEKQFLPEMGYHRNRWRSRFHVLFLLTFYFLCTIFCILIFFPFVSSFTFFVLPFLYIYIFTFLPFKSSLHQQLTATGDPGNNGARARRRVGSDGKIVDVVVTVPRPASAGGRVEALMWTSRNVTYGHAVVSSRTF